MLLALSASLLALVPLAPHPAGPQSVTRAAVHMDEALARSRKLNRQAFNRRNMSVDERRIYDELMEKQAAGARRGAAVAIVAIVAAGFLFANSDPASASRGPGPSNTGHLIEYESVGKWSPS